MKTGAGLLLALCAGALLPAGAENIVFYRSGTATKVVSDERVDRFNMVVDGELHVVDDMDRKMHTVYRAGLDSVVFDADMPVADVLDVEFRADGSAVDVSPMGNEIECHNGATYYSDAMGRHVARFDNSWAGSAEHWFRVDYSNNERFKAALASGHSIEAVVMGRYSGTIADAEAKPFSSHQSGGTGLMVTKANRGSKFCFLPNVSTTGSSTWCWAAGNVKPASGAYYHLVGVYDKSRSVCRLYVNGILESEVPAVGEFVFPTEICNKFTLGGDPDGNNGVSQAWNGDIAVARIYGSPLEERQVEALYRGVSAGVERLNAGVSPKADLLDVEFAADGSARDISPMGSPISRSNAYTYYSEVFGRYVARFDNELGGSDVPNWYRVDYTSNTKFRNGLADGHTMEAVLMVNYSGSLPDAEIKPFSSHQKGGTGLMICKKANGGNKNVLTFLPNVSTSGSSTWCWATSGVEPSAKAFYHVVGVYDKASAKCHIYVNGRLAGSADAKGSMIFPTDGCTKFTLGGDPAANNAVSQGWHGDIAVARIYDKPLGEEEVYLLYRDVHKGVSANTSPISGETVLSDIVVKAGAKMPVWGHGWKSGDVIVLTAADGKRYETATEVDGERGIATLPHGLTSGEYSVSVKRGEVEQLLGKSAFTVADELPAGCKVIAHRGYWTPAGSAHNSRSSLHNAIAAGVYGSECDVWKTTDGASVCYHDSEIGNVTICNNPYSAVRSLTISNGEVLPALNEFLDILNGPDNQGTKLIIEIKTHYTTERTQAAAAEVIKRVKAKGAESKVEFIAFDYGTCQYIAGRPEKYPVQYLGGNKAPSELGPGISIDYKIDIFRSNPGWINDAHKRGLVVNGWTINSNADIGWFNRMGADCVTTDHPDLALKYYEYYQMNR